MSVFEVPVVLLDAVEEHPNADRLELARVGGYRAVVPKGKYRAGQRVVYIPENAIVPEALLRRMALWDEDAGKGRLGGKRGDRVRPVRLRGELSQGVVFEADAAAAVGTDVAPEYGITKYVPRVPTSMSGRVTAVGGFLVSYDIESIQKYPDALMPGETVVVTEKLHGTYACFSHVPAPWAAGLPEGLPNGNVLVASKGLGAKGLAFTDAEENRTNLYLRTWKEQLRDTGVWRRVEEGAEQPVHIMAEIFGRGVQDLHYGVAPPTLRVFDVFIGTPATGSFLDHDAFRRITDAWGLERVPELATAPFSEELVAEHRDGPDTISGSHMREGIVIAPKREREDRRLPRDRVKLKAVSPDYLLRRGKRTEYE